MIEAADSCRPVAQLSLAGADIGDKFLQGLDGDILVDDQHGRIGRNVADRREILDRIVSARAIHVARGQMLHHSKFVGPRPPIQTIANEFPRCWS